MPHDKVRLFETVGWVMVWPVEIVHWRRWAASASLFVFGAMPLYLEFIRPACPLSYAGQIARVIRPDVHRLKGAGLRRICVWPIWKG